MKCGKRNLHVLALLLAIALVLGYAMPAFAQESTGETVSTGESTANVETPSLFAATPASLTAAGGVAIDETNFPDAKFRAWLLDSANIGGAGSDGVLTPEEIAGITVMSIARQSIQDLTGIELFTSLVQFQCSYNYGPFTVPKGLPSGIKNLYFIGNDLTVLPDLPSGLEVLNCSDNKLPELPDLPSGLRVLNCMDNKLSELPALPASLVTLECSNNHFTSLDLSGLGSLNTSYFKGSGQTAYVALLSDGAGGFEASLPLKSPTFADPGISYAGGKLKSNSNSITSTTFTSETGKAGTTLSGTLHLSYPTTDSIEINAANFPDAKFRAILKGYDALIGIKGEGMDGYLTPAEIAGITSLNLSGQGIRDLTGITFFTALTSLNCSNNALTALPTLPASLQMLTCSDNNLTALSALPSSCQGLYCANNDLTALPMLPAGLIALDCSYNPLTTPPTLPNGMMILICSGLGSALMPSTLPSSLITLECSDNGLTSLDVTGLTSLWSLECSDNNLTELDLSGNTNMYSLNCSGNRLTELDVSSLSALGNLNCSGNRLTALDLSVFSATGYFNLKADKQTPSLTLVGNDAAGYSAAIALNNPSGFAAGFDYSGGVLKSTNKALTSTPFTVDTGLAGRTLSGTLSLTYQSDSPTTSYTITASAGSGGSISPSGAVSVMAGASQAFTITPNAQYAIASVIVNGIDQGAISSYTFENVNSDQSIHATFTYTGGSSGSGGASFAPRTLTDPSTGITISGSGIPRDAVLAITDMALHAPGTDDACDAIHQRMKEGGYTLILGKNIALSPGFSGTLTITLPVGAQYNGKIITILHCKNGTLETLTATVANGKATFTVTSLSSFAVFLYDPSVPHNIPKTGDDRFHPLGWLLCTTAIGIAMIARAKKKGITKGQM